MSLELLLPAAFTAGFFGSTHCLAMCGAVVILLEGEQRMNFGGLPRRLVYNSGRLLFYCLLGAVAGATGGLLTGGIDAGLLLLRVLAALLVAALGLTLLFDWRGLTFLENAGAVLWRGLSPLARHVLPIISPARGLAAGFLWGALPCGLVYSAVALAATSGSAASGGLVMLVFGAGTLPALLVAGTSAATLNRWKRRHGLRRVAGAVLLALGLLALVLPALHAGAGGRGRQDNHGSAVASDARWVLHAAHRRYSCDTGHRAGAVLPAVPVCPYG